MRTSSACVGLALLACSSAPDSSPQRDRDSTPVHPQAAPQQPVWTAHPDAVGPVKIGMLLPDLVRLVGGTVEMEDRTPGEGCNYAHLSSIPSAMSFMVFGDTVVRVDVDTTGVKTAEGLGIGSAEDALLERYRGRTRVEQHPYGGPEEHYVVVSTPGDTLHRMTFETDGKTVRSFRVGRGSAVDLIEGCS